MTFQTLATGAVLALISMGSQAAVNIVTNGSFETEQISAPWTSLSTVTGWTSSDNFEIQRGSNFGGQSNFNAAVDGMQYLELNGAKLTTIGQTLQTTANGLYALSFLYSGRPDQTSSESSSMNVLWNGNIVGAVSAPFNSGWQSYSYSVLANSSSSFLSFASTGPASQISYGSYLDAVSVSAVPEPGSLAMMLLGVGMVAFISRRRDDKSTFEPS
ncbi:DUF642 domain-containing protein [Actimicrobium sp. CCC2.4]|uniref:DUF642 domain-containing protein n=1 Tax=Actimicrobium sp. CCC2.4 TaxID=3048606 RepID=UPI002AC966C1|nr:DUF642 domain-containing protein [Actimicrobium sp. CCC2.4]MEB0134951.1 DUF642 domain-containing protein [Actimicrobium sp. CCC2.4]WPX31999.1 DUF642 domain-containing protein [Actimicrobium sp. CCC2.4]